MLLISCLLIIDASAVNYLPQYTIRDLGANSLPGRCTENIAHTGLTPSYYPSSTKMSPLQGSWLGEHCFCSADGGQGAT
jgi:hypothetical protein